VRTSRLTRANNQTTITRSTSSGHRRAPTYHETSCHTNVFNTASLHDHLTQPRSFTDAVPCRYVTLIRRRSVRGSVRAGVARKADYGRGAGR